MSNRKQEVQSNIAALQPEADRLVAAWRDAVKVATDARARFESERRDAERRRSAGASLSDNDRLHLIAIERAALEADDATGPLAAIAAAACLDAEVADGDELACACDPRTAYADLAPLVADVDRLRKELAETERRAADRIAAMKRAWPLLYARRREAGLPAPARVPQPPVQTLRACVDAFAQAAEHGPVAPAKSNAIGIRKLHNEEINLRAALEQNRIDAEEAAAQAARDLDAERKATLRQEQARAQENAAVSAKYRDEQKKREDLAAAHRARTSNRALSDARGRAQGGDGGGPQL